MKDGYFSNSMIRPSKRNLLCDTSHDDDEDTGRISSTVLVQQPKKHEAILKMKTPMVSICIPPPSRDGSLPSLPGPPATSLLRTRSLGRKSVTFDTTEIRKFPIMLDSSRKGDAALTIGWKHHDTEVTTVQDFDMERAFHGTGNARLLCKQERAAVLNRCGYSRSDILRHLAGQDIQKEKEAIKDPKMFSKMKRKIKKLSRSVTV